MVTEPYTAPPIDLEDTPAGRILRTARGILFTENYSGLTMDGLAYALGMSKKTLYAHFPSKEAIAAAIIEAAGATIRRQVGETIALDLPYIDKLRMVLTIVGSHFGLMTPRFLADLARYAPQIAAQIDTVKERNIPMLFGRLLKMGVDSGVVRPDIDVPFMIEYWLQVIKGVHQPDLLARTGLTPKEAFEKALDLFFQGVLTVEGKQQSVPPLKQQGPE
jgi:AcrR family transcriptional regulator